MCGKLIVCDVIWHLPQVFNSVWETGCMRCYLASPSSFLKLHWPVQVQFNASHGKWWCFIYACHCMICHYIVQLDCQYQVTHPGLPTVQCHWWLPSPARPSRAGEPWSQLAWSIYQLLWKWYQTWLLCCSVLVSCWMKPQLFAQCPLPISSWPVLEQIFCLTSGWHWCGSSQTIGDF